MTAVSSKPITDSQISFIQLLKSERHVPTVVMESLRSLWSDGLNQDVADGFIKLLKSFAPRDEVIEAHMALVGYHRLSGRYFRVYRSESDFMYVKEIVFDGRGGVTVEHVSPLVFTALSVDTLMKQHLAFRFDRKLRAAKVIV